MDPRVERRTGDEDLSDAFAVRRDVFIDEQGVSEAEEMDGRDEQAVHVVAYDGDRPVGTARMRRVADDVGKIERVAVRRECRDHGVGSALMDDLESWAAERGVEKIKLHAQTRVESFYRRLGYETTSGVFQEADIDHVKMEKAIGES